MKTTRRQFLKGLIATVAAGTLAPLSLVESIHGASDLTPQERDIAAGLMGLRQKQWSGFDDPRRYIVYPFVSGYDAKGDIVFGQVKLPRDLPEDAVRNILDQRTSKAAVRAAWIEEDAARPYSDWDDLRYSAQVKNVEFSIGGVDKLKMLALKDHPPGTLYVRFPIDEAAYEVVHLEVSEETHSIEGRAIAQL
jgi:hypothetical protein